MLNRKTLHTINQLTRMFFRVTPSECNQLAVSHTHLAQQPDRSDFISQISLVRLVKLQQTAFFQSVGNPPPLDSTSRQRPEVK